MVGRFTGHGNFRKEHLLAIHWLVDGYDWKLVSTVTILTFKTQTLILGEGGNFGGSVSRHFPPNGPLIRDLIYIIYIEGFEIQSEGQRAPLIKL